MVDWTGAGIRAAGQRSSHVDQPTIRVEGRASRWVAADHVDVALTVTRRAATTAEAVAAGSAAHAALDAALAEQSATIVRRTTTSLVVQEVVRWEPDTGRQVPEGFVASRTEVVRFGPVADGAAGAALQAVVAGVPDLGVASPTFGVAADHPVHGEVRAEAAAAARASAAVYASGVGLALGPIQRLGEPKARDGMPFGDTSPRMFAKAEVADAGQTVLVDLSGEDVEVSATVELIAALG